MRKWNIIYIISSIFFALVLFAYATSSNYQRGNGNRPIGSETYTNTIQSVPIQIKYDSDKYFISGFTSEVSVQLTGSNRVALASEMQENTRNLRVVADLSKAPLGSVDIPLSVENLPNGLSATVTPANVTIKIGKKVSKTVEIRAVVPDNQFEEGLSLDTVTTSTARVQVVSDQETLEKVDHVVASLPENIKVTGNYTASVALQAVDKDGNVLPSVINPTEVELKIHVKSSKQATESSKSSQESESKGN